MANWALVENNEIKELHDLLPKSWRNVSGLRLSANDRDFLRSLGWYPVTKNHQEYDRSLFRETGLNHVLENGSVKETLVLAEKQPEPLPSFEELKQTFMADLRAERNQRLRDSDWTQLADVAANMSEDEKTRWSAYRQALRDLPAGYENGDTVDINQVQWPNINS